MPAKRKYLGRLRQRRQRLTEPKPELRGAVRELTQTEDFETIVSGPAETGKTYGCLYYAHQLLSRYPGAQGVMARKTYSSLVGSALRTYKRIIGDGAGVKPYGGEKPEWFDYPNGSRLWVVGLDNPGKALSSERDFIYVNQAEELSLEDWETLTTRCTGRGAVMPFTRMFGDCNPSGPHHWIRGREGLRLLESRHRDNPTLYDAEGKETAQGTRTLAILDKLTGARRGRLREGKWVAAEGQVYEGWDEALHLLDYNSDRFPYPAIPPEWRRLRAVDFGYTNPFVCGWLALDPDGRLYLYREIYRTQRIVRDHARSIRDLSSGEWHETTVCDHDAEDRATLEAEGIPTVPAYKAISVGLQGVEERLRVAGDGKPRLFVMRDALVERDESLGAKHLPVNTAQEFDAYVWSKAADGKPVKEVPVDKNNHGLDMLRYAVAYVDGLGEQDEFGPLTAALASTMLGGAGLGGWNP